VEETVNRFFLLSFSGEFLRATKENIKTYLLVEQSNGYEDILNHRYRSRYKPTP